MGRVATRLRGLPAGPLGPLGDLRFNSKTLWEAGVTGWVPPRKWVRTMRALRRWGVSPATGVTTAAIRCPERTALVDEEGSLTYAELERRSNALARAFAAVGIRPGDGMAIMCRNHRGFVDTTLACAKLGAHALYLNTQFAAPQLAGVIANEAPAALVYDAEFRALVAEAGSGLRRFVWGEVQGDELGLEDLIATADASAVEPPERPSRFVILTSGTTGTPKGAQRDQPETLGPLAAMLARIPLRAEEPTMIAAPLFHGWGFVHLGLGLTLRSTYVLRRRFDPEETLRATAESGATALVVVPVMMQRILELPEEALRRHDLSRLRVTAVSGSALPGELAIRWMDRFGDNVYNIYGTTEVAWATIATPDELRSAPGTAGRPPRGTVVEVVEDGQIFVGNALAFEGYTGGGGKAVRQGLLSTGDVGHFDAEGRLFIDGREDEMIVSGGENVFPREVEDLLSDHPDIREAAVLGVDDEDFGQRLKAFVVADDARVSEDDLKRYVKSNLAGYKVPREVAFMDELPRNATGKVLKRQLLGRREASTG
jgi:acyl-CoA synthetase (AMP-forming)/AMP-acid ligase II